MYKVLTLNKIAKCGLDELDPAVYSVTDDAAENADGIILRSFKMHDMELGSNLKAVARAGAGVNNIPIDKCTEKGIVVFNTPGANANAVKELVIAGLLLSSRNVTGGVSWAQTLTGDDVDKQVEKGKSNFAGCEIKGKTLGVIGLGAIGAMVANSASALGMKVVGYDPYLSVDAAWRISHHVKKANKIEEVLEQSDYITIHVPLMDSTKDTINADNLKICRDGVKILNFARGGLVNTDAVKEALKTGKVSCYITDFPDSSVIGVDGIVPIPHLGASTEESEDNCAMMAAQELSDYLENGNILNSVNFPNVSLPMGSGGRICILHKNVSNMLASFTAAVSSSGLNIDDMVSKSKKDNACTIMNMSSAVNDSVIDHIKSIDGVIAVRVIK